MRTNTSPLLGVALSTLVTIGPLAQPAGAQQATATPTAAGQVPINPSGLINTQVNPTSTPTPSGQILVDPNGPAGVQLNPTPTASTSVNVIPGTVNYTPVPTATPRATAGSAIVIGCPAPSAAHIFQNCPIDSVYKADIQSKLEAAAVTSVLNEYGWPNNASNVSKVMTYGRDDVRAALYSNLIAALGTNAGSRSPEQQAEVSVFADRIKQRHVKAATVAQQQYTLWSNDPCGYRAPAGFTYDPGTACASGIVTLLGGPTPPTFPELQAYGFAAAYPDYNTWDANQAVLAARVATSLARGMAVVGWELAAPGAVIGSAYAPFAVLEIYSPHLARTLATTALRAAGVAEEFLSESGAYGEAFQGLQAWYSEGLAGEFGEISLGGPVAIITLAIIIGVTQGIAVVDAAQIPDQLAADLSAAQSYDLAAAVNASDLTTSAAARQELYADLISTTTPDFPPSAPAAQPGDPQFVLSNGTTTSTLNYVSPDGTHHSAEVHGGVFVDTADNTMGLGIDYVDPDGVGRLASFSGGHFLVRREGRSLGAAPTPTINVVDWMGHPLSVTLAGSPPAEAWAIGSTSVNVGGNAPEHFDPTTAKLAAVDGGAVGVAVGPSGQPWIFNQQGTIFRRTRGSNSYMDGKWEVVPGKVSDLAVGGDGSVWAVGVLQANIGGNIIYYYNQQVASSWDQVDGGAVAIAVSPDGQPWIVNKQGTIFRRSLGKNGYVDGTWQVVPGQATDIAIGADGSVWAIGVLQANIGGKMIYHYNPNTPSSWDQVDGGAVSIAVDASGVPWLVNAQGAVFRRGVGKTGYVDGTWIAVAPNGTATNIGVGGPLS